MAAIGTYVFCLVAAPRRPTLARVRAGPAGLGPVRLIEVDPQEWLVAADAPLNRYGEETINKRLSDLDWVARAAVAHEAVIESFISAPAVLPMKLFTIFTNDERAVDHVRRDRRRIEALIARVRNHHEWGVRVVLDRMRAAAAGRAGPIEARTGRSRGRRAKRSGDDRASGAAYLTRKKAQRDAAAELAERAQETVAELYDHLSEQARLAKRRLASELPVQGGPLLLDAAFLVPASRSTRFRASTARHARALEKRGYRVTLSGPWPPYSFIQD